jgi:dUTP pyrophosphatase
MELKFKKLLKEAELPVYASAGAACFDLKAISGEPGLSMVILPGDAKVFRTGLAVEVPAGKVLKIYSRSGHGFKNGVRLSNGTGIIDSDYRGELMVSLHNDGTEGFYVKYGDRIAQAMLEDAPQATFVEVDELDSTERGSNGFGSTGS